jgi:hypothetical protein
MADRRRKQAASIKSRRSTTAIACATGGFKGVFVSGVLDAFEVAGFKAEAYAGASSSVLPAAAAAVGQSQRLGLDHWRKGQQMMAQPRTNMSSMILAGIAENGGWITEQLFVRGTPRFVVAVSAVSEAAAEETQGEGARRRGRLLLLAAARGERQWIDDHLRPVLFDSAAADARLRLTGDNFEQVAYASTRMLHAWDIPAWIGGRPYVDAFYTCACPATEMVDLGYEEVIALATEPALCRDIVQDRRMPDSWRGRPIHIVRPDYDPAQTGVNYTSASEAGLAQVYEHGRQQAIAFLDRVQG